MKSLRLILMITASASTLLAQSPQNPADKVVATINGEVLTARDFDQIYSRLSPQLREGYEKSGGKLQFLDVYIKRRLLIQEALKQGFDKRPDIAFDLQMARDSTLFDRYVREVVAAPVVPESELLAYYNSHQDEFKRPEMIRVRHIIATPEEAPVMNTTGDNAGSDEEALEKIKKLAMAFKTVGGDFVDLAKKFSEDNTAPAGGDLGWFGRGKMVPEFEDAAFRLERRGETSPVVKTQFGYHVLMLEDRKPAGAAPFAEVRREIREKLLAERQAQILAEVGELTNELRANSRIAVYPENL